MAIATLTVDLVAKLASFENDIGRIGTLAQRQADQMDRAFSGVRSTLAGLGAAVSLGGAIAAFRSATDALDRLNDAADATGASVESLSKLENVARRNGAGIELVETAVLKMNKALSATDEEGKGAARIIKALGLSADELLRADPAIAVQKMAIAFQGFANDGTRARAVQEFFGKTVAEVAPFLKDLAEAGELNATVTARQAEEAEKFNKSLYALQTNAGNLGRAIASDMLPAINRAIEQMAEGTRIAGGFLNALRVFGTSSLNMDNAGQKIREFTDELAALQAQRDRYAESGPTNSLDEALTRTVVAPLDRQIADLKAKIEFAKVLQRQAALKGAELLGDTGGERAFRTSPGSLNLPGTAKAQKVTREDFAAYEYARFQAQALEKELEALAKREADLRKPMNDIIGRLREQARGLEDNATLAGLTEDEIADLYATQIEEAATLAELNGAYQSQIDDLRMVAEGYRDVADAAGKKRIAEALAGTATGKLEAQRREMQFYAAAVEKGAITAEQFAEIATSKLGLVADETVRATSEANVFGQILTSAFEDAIIEGENLRKVVQALAKDIARAAIRQGITQPLGNAVGGFVGALFGQTPSGGAASGIGSNLASSLVLQGITSAFGGTAGIVSGISSLAAGTTLGSFGAGFAGGLSSFGSLSATTASIGAAGTGTAAGFGYALGAIAPYLAAIVAVASLFMGESTPHAGATVFGSEGLTQTPKTLAEIDKLFGNPSGARSPYSGPGLFYESDFTKRFSSDVAEALDPLALNLAETFNKITRGAGLGGGFRVGIGFSADDNDKSRGRFAILDAAGGVVEEFRKRFASDPSKGLEQFGLAAQQGLLAGLRELDLGAKVNAVLDKSLSDSADQLYQLSQDQTTALLSLLEGGVLDDLFANLELADTSWASINDRIEQFARIIDLKPLFDRVGVSITEFGVDLVNALGGAEKAAATLQSVLDFRDVQAAAANLFAGSIRNIKFGVLDDPGKYEFLDKEAQRFRDVLATLSDASLIQDYAAKLNDAIISGFNVLTPEMQSQYSADFIKRLESASQLTQDRLAVAQDKQFAVFEQLPDKTGEAVAKALRPTLEAINRAVSAGVSIDLRLPAGFEVG